MTSLRSRYMDHEDDFSFRDYYGALVEHLGEERLRQLLPGVRTPDEWLALVNADHHLNNVPLAQWDHMAPFVRSLVRANDELLAITGSGGWSLSDSTCVLKETARRYSGTSVRI